MHCDTTQQEKHGPDGEIAPYKVQIVAGGHNQAKGVNYSETFPSAAKMLTMQVVLANTTTYDWEIEHVDVKSMYLNTTLKKAIYMNPLCRVLKPEEEGKVCHLIKGLFRLKQAHQG